MNRARKYQVERPKPGILTHREGGTEFQFPVYDEDGEIVFVAWPTRKRIFLYFLMNGWTRVPGHFSSRDRDRITADIRDHFQSQGVRVRVLNCPGIADRSLQFHPELFEYKGRASEMLDAAGVAWFSDYSSIDLLHEEFGLEVCGIREESNVEPVARAMSSEFPHWHYQSICFKDCGRDPGWIVRLHMFPARAKGGCS